MNLKNKLLAHRARKKFIIGSNKIAMLACVFYLFGKMSWMSNLSGFRYWGNDMIFISVVFVLLLAWEILMWLFRIKI